jgi:predicted acyl esterase
VRAVGIRTYTRVLERKIEYQARPATSHRHYLVLDTPEVHQRTLVLMHFQNITVSQRALQPSDSPLSQWTGLTPETVTLSAGYVKELGRRAFFTDTLFERDAVIPLRDGHTLRADIFRPVSVDDARVPALVVWSPYGKTGTGASSFLSESA